MWQISERGEPQILKLNWQFGYFDTIYQKRVFLVKTRKSEHHNWILRIRISQGTKFQLKLTILIFCAKFAPKKVFLNQNRNVNSSIEFCIFDLV